MLVLGGVARHFQRLLADEDFAITNDAGMAHDLNQLPTAFRA